jgi:hypothetical protein
MVERCPVHLQCYDNRRNRRRVVLTGGSVHLYAYDSIE